MKIINKQFDLQTSIKACKQLGQQIGFVPTMGALHNGHLNLIKQARKENDIVVCSIFVNPIQFNNKEDLEKYPRMPEKDISLIKQYCDICFMPSVEEMFPTPPTEQYNFGTLETVMEGAMRPGHFNGVGIIVGRLFHIVEPNKAYFGKKDFQQLVIIRRLVEMLNLPIEICPIEIARDNDGLALSSRNQRLSKEARKIAPFIYQTLVSAKQQIEYHSPKELEEWIIQQFTNNKNFKLEYVQIVDGNTLQQVTDYQSSNSIIICIAAWLDNIRLIDNIAIK